MNKAALSLAVVVVLCLLVWQHREASHGHSLFDYHEHLGREPIKVGVVYSLIGSMSAGEKPLIEAIQLAIDEVNAAGGLLGRDVEVVLADGRSDLSTYRVEAERLIADERVSAVFGCRTSDCRKTLKPLFERHDHLLFYPLQYEGLEQSPNIIYTGAAPNQQIIPAVRWSIDNLGPKLYVVGSDFVFPRAASAIIRDQMGMGGAEVVGESYVAVGSNDFDQTVADIIKVEPDVILNALNGSSNAAFFRALRAAGIDSGDIPTVSFSMAENDIKLMDSTLTVGDYASWTYFQSLPTDFNRRFVDAFRKKYGARRVVSDPMEAAYTAVHLWASAVRSAGSADPGAVRGVLPGQTFAAPQGPVAVDRHNNHLWKSVYIGQITNQGQFDIVWGSGAPVKPAPYPPSREQKDWHWMLDNLYDGWGQRWSVAPS